MLEMIWTVTRIMLHALLLAGASALGGLLVLAITSGVDVAFNNTRTLASDQINGFWIGFGMMFVATGIAFIVHYVPPDEWN